MIEIFYVIALITLFSFLVLKLKFFRLDGIKKIYVLAALYLKILAGFAMAFIYSDHYTERSKADIYKYFDDSEIMYNAIHDNPADYCKMLFGFENDNQHFDSTYYCKMNNWYRGNESVTYNDSHTIIRINAFFRLFSFGYFSIHTLLFILLSFIGTIALFKTFSACFKKNIFPLFIAIFLIPSVVFWTSSALKESVLIFALGIFIYSTNNLLLNKPFSIGQLITALVGLFFLIYIKMYILAVFIPVIFAHFWIKFTGNRRPLFKYSIALSIYIILGIVIAQLFPNYNFFELLVLKQKDLIFLAQTENAGSLISPLNLEPTISSFALNAPIALINTTFRPFLGDISSILMIPSLFENIILIILIALCCIFPIRENKNKETIYFCLFFSILLLIIVGYTTPVLGASVRYRIPALPFLAIALFLIIDFNKIKYYLSKKEKK